MLGKGAEDAFGMEELLQQRKGTDQRTAKVADAAQDDHDRHGAAEVPAQQLRVEVPSLTANRKPAKPATAPEIVVQIDDRTEHRLHQPGRSRRCRRPSGVSWTTY